MTIQELTDQQPELMEVQAAVRKFLQAALPQVRRLDITKVAPVTSGDGVWEAEAVVWQPNPTIAALGLAAHHHAVLDQNYYVVRLDGRLNVIAYEPKLADSP
jgi:hypothetical protein